jgi:hypothetical protein
MSRSTDTTRHEKRESIYNGINKTTRMRLSDHHRTNLFVFTLFMLVLVGAWFVMYERSKRQLKDKEATNTKFSAVMNQMITRPTTPEELLAQKSDKISLPYKLCYYNNPADPTLWYTDTYEIKASSPIVRMTRPIPIDKQDPCTGSTTPLFDLRTDLGTVNEGYNARADEIIKMFIEQVYANIVVEMNTIVKNINYSPVTSIYRLSVATVYQDNQAKYNVLVNQFALAQTTGELSNDPPQAIDRVEGIFSQINRQGQTRIRNAWTLYGFFAGRSTSTNTVEMYAESGYNKLIGSLSLVQTKDQYIWVEIPIQTTVLFFKVTGPGTIELNRSYFYLFPTNSKASRMDARYVTTPTIPPPPPPPPPPPGSPPPPSELAQGQTLNVNSALISPNGNFSLLYQSDGDLVFRTLLGTVIWSAGVTSAQPSRFGLPDITKLSGNTSSSGNLILVDAQQKEYWSTKLDWGVRKLVVGNDGTVKLFKKTQEMSISLSGIQWNERWNVEWSVP